LMGRAGVSNDTTVVCYSDMTMFATRLWWVLNYYGHTKAKVLNGGWRRWTSEGRPVTTAEWTPQHVEFTPRPNHERICLIDDLLTRYSDPNLQVLNVLPEGMYAGRDNPFENKHPGHIPGSINIDSDRFVDEAGAFKSAPQLSEILSAAGVRNDREVVVHCQGGIRTTIGFFVLSLLGHERARAYDGSMGEWSNRDDTPVTTGTS
jgi:thiosulfate/3-mercaptopyruvate sulfurtransferase